MAKLLRCTLKQRKRFTVKELQTNAGKSNQNYSDSFQLTLKCSDVQKAFFFSFFSFFFFRAVCKQIVCVLLEDSHITVK